MRSKKKERNSEGAVCWGFIQDDKGGMGNSLCKVPFQRVCPTNEGYTRMCMLNWFSKLVQHISIGNTTINTIGKHMFPPLPQSSADPNLLKTDYNVFKKSYRSPKLTVNQQNQGEGISMNHSKNSHKKI